MKSTKPLTKKQRQFAEQHHDLIYAFLKDKDLDVEEFYDIAVFGYLRAVRRYLSEKILQKYSFATIAWRAMNADLITHFRYSNRPSRNAPVVSLNDLIYGDRGYTLEDILGTQDRLMQQLEADLLLHELVSALPTPTNRIVALKAKGYNCNEIGKAVKLRNGVVTVSYTHLRAHET